ncbi:hypothetical protein EUX98_g3902 [Antrodiella citrinella]|uniref:Protein YOP1 n=1 Tax=Antrodiella citrinella TaxID=2447956 RepID=A0A4S4N3G0_9APHY|nr:hypothetical protein EUX98_g3902 [Antrodiella citrinella]
MPLILPLLRALWVSSIVYDSFKTLKPPPPSEKKNGSSGQGQPSVRAMSQRKRNMKGCMTVWLIWCCFATYERTLDTAVGIFIPFYDEIKSLLILFFLVTSTRGAEPVYLHVLRPAIKPYTSELDALMDLVIALGDVAVMVMDIPLSFVGMSISEPPQDPRPQPGSRAPSMDDASAQPEPVPVPVEISEPSVEDDPPILNL